MTKHWQDDQLIIRCWYDEEIMDDHILTNWPYVERKTRWCQHDLIITDMGIWDFMHDFIQNQNKASIESFGYWNVWNDPKVISIITISALLLTLVHRFQNATFTLKEDPCVFITKYIKIKLSYYHWKTFIPNCEN